MTACVHSATETVQNLLLGAKKATAAALLAAAAVVKCGGGGEGARALGSADAFGAASEEIETNAARASTASLALPTCSVFCAKGAGRGAEKEEPGGGGGGRGRAPGGEEGGGGRSDAAFVERRVERRGRRGKTKENKSSTQTENSKKSGIKSSSKREGRKKTKKGLAFFLADDDAHLRTVADRLPELLLPLRLHQKGKKRV